MSMAQVTGQLVGKSGDRTLYSYAAVASPGGPALPVHIAWLSHWQTFTVTDYQRACHAVMAAYNGGQLHQLMHEHGVPLFMWDSGGRGGGGPGERGGPSCTTPYALLPRTRTSWCVGAATRPRRTTQPRSSRTAST